MINLENVPSSLQAQAWKLNLQIKMLQEICDHDFQEAKGYVPPTLQEGKGFLNDNIRTPWSTTKHLRCSKCNFAKAFRELPKTRKS